MKLHLWPDRGPDEAWGIGLYAVPPGSLYAGDPVVVVNGQEEGDRLRAREIAALTQLLDAPLPAVAVEAMQLAMGNFVSFDCSKQEEIADALSAGVHAAVRALIDQERAP